MSEKKYPPGRGQDKQNAFDAIYGGKKKKTANERPNIGDASVRSRNGSPSRKR